MNKTALTSSLFSLVLTAAFPMISYAATAPSFPTCVNPQGTLAVSYDNGVHGVVGMTDEKTGSDKVYQLSGNDQLMQCYCPDNGNGIQTNWWKVSSLSSTDIEEMKKEGWIYVADGSAWGLDSAPYLAKNSDYNCKPSTSTTPTPTPNSPTQQVLGLANTGNILFVYTLAVAGLASLVTGLLLRSKKS